MSRIIAPNLNRWPGATGLAEDVCRYGYWMREEAKRIGYLYPKVKVRGEGEQRTDSFLSKMAFRSS